MSAVTGHEVRTQNDLRCFCSRRPKLAKYGLDQGGRTYVHIKIFKQRQVFGEVLIQEGVVKILCRECLRWHVIKIVAPEKAVLEQIPEPEEVALPPFLQPRSET